ncbi:MAG: efflux RND transporter periplasmic adaptor subunit [Verrucomicrobia bacterium]|nr:efflux RND transporter periplasmic adaptor subunit [Verrucomicrobiota bacterium]
MKRISFRKLLPWVVALVVLGSLVYYIKFRPLPVLAHTIVKGEISGEVMGTGTLEARVKTTVSPRIQGRLDEVLVDQGDMVKSGQLLARLDDAESRQQVAIAEATLAAAKQTAERVRSDLARSEAVLAQAQLDHRRQSRLVATKAVAQSDADKAAEALRIAEADLKRSHATIAEAEGQIAVAEKNLLYRREQLAFTEIRSPYDELIIRRDRDAGDVLVPGASLMQMISLDELWVSAWVDETAMPSLAPDQPARIVYRSEPGRSYPGKVSRLGREMDRETREFLVDVRAAELPMNWTVGQRAEVFIETARQADALLLPPAYLGWKAGRAGVFVNAGGKAQWREVALGLRGKDYVAITKGLSVGEQVARLAEGQKAALTDGQRIKPR